MGGLVLQETVETVAPLCPSGSRGKLEGYEKCSSLTPAVRDSDIVCDCKLNSSAPAKLRSVLKANPTGLVIRCLQREVGTLPGIARPRARSGKKVASIHPMFGPNVAHASRSDVVVCDCGSKEGTALAKWGSSQDLGEPWSRCPWTSTTRSSLMFLDSHISAHCCSRPPLHRPKTPWKFTKAQGPQSNDAWHTLESCRERAS